MTTTTEELPVAHEVPLDDMSTGAETSPYPDPDLVLVPKISDRWAFSWGQMLLVLGVCLFFMYYNYMKLFHSDFWGHVAYGRWMLEHRALPAEEIFVATAQGMSITCTAWLSQVLLGLVALAGQDELFSHLFAVTVLAGYLILAAAYFQQTRHAAISLLAALLTWFFAWSRHAIVRPEVLGTLCFATLIALTVWSDSARQRLAGIVPEPLNRRRLGIYLAGILALFVIWANLHGSFIVGLALLGAYALGRATEVLWERRDFQAVLSDRLFQQRMLAAEVALAGTLINPYGFDLLIHTLVFPSNPNLKDIWEWYPLEMMSLEGPFMVLSWTLLILLVRHSRRRFAASDVFTLLIFTGAVCLRVRMISWYAPALMLVLTPHLADVVGRVVAWLDQGELGTVFARLRMKSFRITLLTGLAVWVTFCFSPISVALMGGKPRESKHVYSKDTPRGVTKYLRENPPKGMVASPQWWGDWLVWDGPKDLQVLMTTNAVHVVPARAWKDYLAIARGDNGLEERLDRYRVNTIVICKELQGDLRRAVDQLSGWVTVFEDDVGIVVMREHMAPKEVTPAKDEKQLARVDAT